MATNQTAKIVAYVKNTAKPIESKPGTVQAYA